jgi:hypothetical protein
MKGRREAANDTVSRGAQGPHHSADAASAGGCGPVSEAAWRGLQGSRHPRALKTRRAKGVGRKWTRGGHPIRRVIRCELVNDCPVIAGTASSDQVIDR